MRWLLVPAPALLPMLLLLGGCGGTAPDAATASCRARAVQDPAVQAAILRANSPLQEVRVLGVHEQQVAMRRAVQRCLAVSRGQPAGGVEPVQGGGGWLGPSLF